VPSRHRIVIVVAAGAMLAACGGAGGSSADRDGSTPLRPQVATTTTSLVASTITPRETAAPRTSPPVPVTATDCPNGTWRIDPAGLGPLDLLGSADDVTLTSEGSFIAVFGNGTYTITAEAFSLDLLMSASDMGMVVAGSTSGTLAIGADVLTFTETSFDMTADVTIDGEDAPSGFIVNAFQQTFGSATVPYTCNADGTVTITYDTPTGPTTVVQEPA
jgi:hypothetical protein